MDTLELAKPLFNEMLSSIVKQHAQSLPVSKTLPKDVYCNLYNITPDAIRKRLQKGIWQTGVHVLKVRGAGEYIDLEAVDAWVRKEGKSSHAG